MSTVPFRVEGVTLAELATASVRLGSNEILFQTGDAKTCLYRVESGAVALYERQWNGYDAAIEFALPGDLVGLGFLEYHACCARAIAETQLTSFPLEAQASMVDGNPKAQAKLDSATEREFEFHRATLVEHLGPPLRGSGYSW